MGSLALKGDSSVSSGLRVSLSLVSAFSVKPGADAAGEVQAAVVGDAEHQRADTGWSGRRRPRRQPPMTTSWVFQILSLIHDDDRRPGW